MTDLVAAVAAVLREHRPGTKRINHPWRKGILLNIPACKGCDWAEEDGDHDAHVAELAVAGLGLHEEWGVTRDGHRICSMLILDAESAATFATGYDRATPALRWVSEWMGVQP